jgi:hypothetical protein
MGPVEWDLSASGPDPLEVKKVLDSLERDFAAFERPSEVKSLETIKLFLKPAPLEPDFQRLRRAFRFRDAVCFGWFGLRRVVYADGSEARVDHTESRASIYATSAERLHELAYLYLLSKSGEHLDRIGLHRVHALGVVSRKTGGAVLMPMDSGTGKSTLA